MGHAGHGRLLGFTPWTFAGIVFIKPQLFLDMPRLRVVHGGVVYMFDAQSQRLTRDPAFSPPAYY
jgi:hypothetical protein